MAENSLTFYEQICYKSLCYTKQKSFQGVKQDERHYIDFIGNYESNT